MSLLRIPDTLWRDGILQFSRPLADALQEELSARGLLAEASGPYIPDKELFGGKESEEALKHFTHRFKTSAARVAFVALDPSGTFQTVSTDLLATLFDGQVAVLDIPCGSGGGLFGCSWP